MKISFQTRVNLKNMNTKNGYGSATEAMLKSWSRCGISWGENVGSGADINFMFDQPHHFKHSPNQYNILYVPWESTSLAPGWAQVMNTCDEVWTPSPLIADWYTRYAGIERPVYVYEHGIEHDWAPRRRSPDALRLLQVGADDTRKGFWDTTFPSFRTAFPARNGRRLVCKTTTSSWNKVGTFGGVEYNNEKLPFNELIDLFYDCDAYVYPSWGEGFGLTPLQAMATGMPTITLPGWAPYARFIDPNLAVGHTLVDSPWPDIHPGKMMRPNGDDVVRAMRYLDAHYAEAADFAMEQAEAIHREYDWDTLTARAFGDLEHRLK